MERTRLECEDIIRATLASDRFKSVVSKLSGSNLEVCCRVCSRQGVEGHARAYLEINPPKVVLCSNKIQPKDVEELLAHELTHAHDYIFGKCDLETCKGLAYSEVRAAREGECNGFFLHDYFRKQCIRNHAIRSTENLFPSGAERCVDDVFDVAMADLEPFRKSRS
mmetsp:Transcript_16848/g.25338  ORF Transcript_16848/g.25338 Transcript_16848/m.25338 type:complete len:166 (+) Transcript_16848:139-636(+)